MYVKLSKHAISIVSCYDDFEINVAVGFASRDQWIIGNYHISALMILQISDLKRLDIKLLAENKC